MYKISLKEAVGVIRDPRQGWKVSHRLVNIVVMAVCAVMKGAEGWTDVAEWCKGLTDCIVTLDAMGTQPELAAQIVAGGADYGLLGRHPT